MNRELLTFVVCFLFNLFDMIIIIRYMNHLYGKTVINKRLFSGAALVLIMISTKIMLSASYFILWGITALSLVMLLAYPKNKRKKLLFGVILVLIALVSIVLTFVTTMTVMSNFTIVGVLTVLLPHLLFLSLTEAAAKLNRTAGYQISFKMWILLLSIPITSLISIPCLIILIENSKLSTHQTSALEIPMLVIILYINLIVFYLYEKFNALLKTGIERALLKQQISLQERYYQNLEQTHQRIKSIRHDMKNNLETISYLLSENQTKKLQSYLKNITDNVQNTERIIYTGNPPIDSVLNIKLSELKQQNIQVNTNILIPQNLKINFEQAVVLFGNIIDNAIEACQLLSKNQRWINFKMSYTDNILYISLINSADKTHLLKNNLLQSRKEDKFLHGLGLKNVQKIVDEFKGIMKISTDNDSFHLKIILYNI